MLRMKIAMVFVSALLLGACASSQPEILPGPSVEGVVVTVKNSGVVFPAGTTFSWSEAASQFYRDARLDNAHVQTLLQDAIEQALVSRGYKVVEQGGEFEIGYVAALSRSLSDVEIDQRFGVNPGMLADSKENDTYEKGTVVVDVDDPRSRQTLWRSALQGYVVFDMPEDDRQRRVTQAIERIFTSFPAGY